jgi:hypothetical protein
MAITMSGYRKALHAQLWRFVRNNGLEPRLDSTHGGVTGPPVLSSEAADANILLAGGEDEATRRRVLAQIAVKDRHRWFRSMASSQALAQSVFGNLIARGKLACLAALRDGEGRPLFFSDVAEVSDAGLEHSVGNKLGEARSTSVDLWLGGSQRVAVECKLAETKVGPCSRPSLKAEEMKYCDGNLLVRPGRSHACSLVEYGDAHYWTYLPELLGWAESGEARPCPLASAFQLVRNLLAACVYDGSLDPGGGHSLLVVDARNPAFKWSDGHAIGRGSAAFDFVRAALGERASLLRLCSWQQIAGALAQDDEFAWLVAGLRAKYGIEAGSRPLR